MKLLHGIPCHILSVKYHFAGGWICQSDDRLSQGGFSASGFPHHAQCPSFFQGKRDIVHRMKDPAAYLKVFFQMIYFKQCHLLFLLLCIDTFHKVPWRHFRQYGITAFTLFRTF